MRNLVITAVVILLVLVGGHVLVKSLLTKDIEAMFEREKIEVEVETVALESWFYSEVQRGTLLVSRGENKATVDFRTVGNPLYGSDNYYLELAGEDMAKLRVGSFFNKLRGR